MKKITKPITLRLQPETVRPLTALALVGGGLAGTETLQGSTNSTNCRVTWLPGFCF